MPLLFALLLLLAGCATQSAAVRPAPQPRAVVAAAPPAHAVNPAVPVAPAPVQPARPVVASAAPTPDQAAAADDADDDSDDAADGEDADEGDDAEAEPHTSATGDATGLHYTTDLSDAELERLWKQDPSKLGSMSVGFVDAGRLINGEQLQDGPGWTVVVPQKCWGTHETVSYLEDALRHFHQQFPVGPPARINQIGVKDGGWLRPHKSHQNGRDVDVGFIYPNGQMVHARAREKYIDVPRTWAVLKDIISYGDVQFVLTDRHVQKVLYDYALAHGEDQAWLDSLFHAGKDSLVKHARHHRDHFHVRYYNPRAQELGRRVAPLLAQQPEYNVAMHRVRRGDNLGRIALKYGSTVAMIRKANHMKNNFLRVGRVLSVPLRGACTHCPIPPEVIVPPRDLPPELRRAAAELAARAQRAKQRTQQVRLVATAAELKPAPAARVVNVAIPQAPRRPLQSNAASGELPAARAP